MNEEPNEEPEEEPEEEPKGEAEEKPKLIIYVSKENEAECGPAVEEAKRIADESGLEMHELDVADLDFPKELLGERGGTPTTCVASGGSIQCFVGRDSSYKEKLLEIIKKIGERRERTVPSGFVPEGEI